jgi:class 3 adenylate cyclase
MRIGGHTGEIELLDNGDILGTAVNLAARVQTSAEPGSIFVSSTVRDLMLGGDLDFLDQGQRDLKGFDSPWGCLGV